MNDRERRTRAGAVEATAAVDPVARGRAWLVTGALCALVAVAAGAFAAHGLRARLTPDLLAVFETGARYQMYHALALVACGLAAPRLRPRLLAWSGALFVAGIVLFSGSLYLLALTGVRALGAVTPFGGLAWLVAWLLFALACRRQTAQ
jgi:uncharacterized membrane protein YgdD (TMEM256/DUF423 family)